MKNTIRLLSLVLVLVMMLSSLAACGKKEPAETQKPSTSENTPTTQAPIVTEGNDPAVTQKPAETKPAETEPPVVDKWADVNFEGEEIIISLSEYVPIWVSQLGAGHVNHYIEGIDQYSTDSVQNAVFDRNRKVSEKLGINPKYTYYKYTSREDETVQVIENFVLADLEEAPDIVSTMSYGVVRAAIKGLLYNVLSDGEGKNYFDIKNEYGWYEDFMKEITLDKEKLYILAGDYFIDVLRYANGVLVNIDMYNDLFASEGGIDSLYETVNSGEWTYDELMRCADVAYIDNGAMDVNSSTFGAVALDAWIYRDMFSTSGLDVFEEVDGQIRYRENISDIHTFLDKMLDMFAHDSFLNPATQGGTAPIIAPIFTGNRALFMLDQPVLSLEGSQIRNMEHPVGMLPYPKYKQDAEYGALVSDNGNVGGILYNSDKFTPASAFLQMMCEESYGGKGTLIYEYYDVTLKYKYSANAGQVKMLEIIREGLSCPKSLLFDNYFAKNVSMQTYGGLIRAIAKSNTNTFASDWASQYSAVQGSLEETIVKYGDQD